MSTTDIIWLPVAYKARVAAGDGRASQMLVSENVPVRIEPLEDYCEIVAVHVDRNGRRTAWSHHKGEIRRPLRDPVDARPVSLDRLHQLIDAPALLARWADYPLFDPLDPDLNVSPFSSEVIRGTEGLTITPTNRLPALGVGMRLASELRLEHGVITKRTREPVLQIAFDSRNSSCPHRLLLTDLPHPDAVTFRLDEIDLAKSVIGKTRGWPSPEAYKAVNELDVADGSNLAFSSEDHARRSLRRLIAKVEIPGPLFDRHRKYGLLSQVRNTHPDDEDDAIERYVDEVSRGLERPSFLGTSDLDLIEMHTIALIEIRRAAELALSQDLGHVI